MLSSLYLYIIIIFFLVGAGVGVLVGAEVLMVEQTRKNNKGCNIVSKLCFQLGAKLTHFPLTRWWWNRQERTTKDATLLAILTHVLMVEQTRKNNKGCNIVSKLCFQLGAKVSHFSLTSWWWNRQERTTKDATLLASCVSNSEQRSRISHSRADGGTDKKEQQRMQHC